MIMLVGVVEKNTQAKYITLNSWINSSDAKIDELLSSLRDQSTDDAELVKNAIQKLSEQFNSEHAARNNFADFIENFASSDEQSQLILGFGIPYQEAAIQYSSRLLGFPSVNNINELKEKNIEVTRAFLPKCYNWKKCWATYSQCDPAQGCLLDEDPEIKKNTSRWIAKFIYDMRSQVIHKASHIQFLTNVSAGVSSSSYVMKDNKPILITISIEEVQKIITNSLKRFFDKLQI